jgi:3-oxoacyl-[acyl-carrier-protein] synthase II
MSTPVPRRVAITGLGAVTALGNTRDITWRRLITGECGIKKIRAWDPANYATKIAGEIQEFDPAQHFASKRLRRMDRCHQLAIVASREALEDAGLLEDCPDPTRVGIIIGSSLGGMLSGQQFDRELTTKGRYRGHLLLNHPLHVCVDELTTEFGFLGPRAIISTACTASTIALGHAVDVIRAGQADIVLSGGMDPLSEFSFAGFSSMKNVSAYPCAPFSEPIGLTTGEGAGMLVLEDMDRALARGARIYAELVHYALSADAYHPTSPDPTAQNQKRAMLEALRCGNIRVDEVDYVNAHGTGTSGNDQTETRVLNMVFGDRAQQIPVSSVKGALGHTLGAAGGVEALVTALSVHHGIVPPTVNFTKAREGCPLDYVPNEGRKQPVTVAVSQNFAFGGNNAVLVLARHDRPESRPLQLASHRVMLTGLGVVSPLGCGTADFLAAIRDCRDGIQPMAGTGEGPFAARKAGLVCEESLSRAVKNRPRRVDRLGLFTIAGSELAMQDAGIKVTRENAERIGIVVGTAFGPVQSCKVFHKEVALDCPQKANPAIFPNTVVNAGAGLAAINLRVRGPNVAMSLGQASGLAAVAYGYELIRTGAADVIIAGGAEELEAYLLNSFAATRLSAPYLGKWELSCPFDERHSGMVLGEGASFLVLESAESAAARGARVYGELRGYHCCADRPIQQGWDPSGEGVARAMQTALSMAGMEPSTVGYLGAGAMSDPRHDAIEARAIEKVFGHRGVPVGALSSMVGMSAATGPMILGAALLGMNQGFLPAGINYERPDAACDLDVVAGKIRPAAIQAVMVNAASLRGSNVSIVAGRC